VTNIAKPIVAVAVGQTYPCSARVTVAQPVSTYQPNSGGSRGKYWEGAMHKSWRPF